MYPTMTTSAAIAQANHSHEPEIQLVKFMPEDYAGPAPSAARLAPLNRKIVHSSSGSAPSVL